MSSIFPECVRIKRRPGQLPRWEEHWGRYVQSEVKMPYRTLMFDSAADHLLSGREDVATAAAQFTRRGYSEDNFKGLMSILDDSGFADKPRAIKRLRQHCPPEHLAAFRALIGKNVNVRAAEPPRSSAQEQQRGGDQTTTAIGQQVWMVENLNVDTYRNGDPIPPVQDPVAWKGLSTGAWCFYENKVENGTTWGRLYNWYAVNDVRGLAPEGWHIPSDDEWRQLINALGEQAVRSSPQVAGQRAGTGLTGAVSRLCQQGSGMLVADSIVPASLLTGGHRRRKARLTLATATSIAGLVACRYLRRARNTGSQYVA